MFKVKYILYVLKYSEKNILLQSSKLKMYYFVQQKK